jgi:hypothetical protein
MTRHRERWRMTLAGTTVAAVLLTLGAALAACGGASSSSGDGQDVAGAPTDASQDDFCRTFAELGDDVAPHEAAVRLTSVGTPEGISASARNGFVLLVSRLLVLPDDSQDDDLASVAKGLRGGDQSDVIAFVTYYASACAAPPSM